jgi:hypothetical protein
VTVTLGLGSPGRRDRRQQHAANQSMSAQAATVGRNCGPSHGPQGPLARAAGPAPGIMMTAGPFKLLALARALFEGNRGNRPQSLN